MSSNKLYVRKSNSFVTAKFKTTLLGNKIIALSLTKLEEEGSQVKAVLYPAELRRVLSMYDDKNIYKKLKAVSQTLHGNIITVEDGKGNFKTFTMITNAEYVDQKFTLYYNKEMKPFISRLKTNYTTYELATLVNFKKNYTYRLYELLKKDAWRINSSKGGFIRIRYGLNELKAMIGLVNTDASYIQKAIASNKYTWDEIVENIAKPEDRQFDRFADFKTRVLEASKKEMRASDIGFTYTLEKTSHGKVSAIEFIISYNVPDDTVKEKLDKTAQTIEDVVPEFVKEEEEFLKDVEVESVERVYMGQHTVETYDEMLRFLKSNGVKSLGSFTVDYFSSLLDLAGGDIEVIKAQVLYGKTVRKIDNYYGWLLEAVRRRFAGNTVPYADGEETSGPSVSDEDGSLAKGMWARIKKKDSFPDFLSRLKLPVPELEDMYTPGELVEMYAKYVRHELV